MVSDNATATRQEQYRSSKTEYVFSRDIRDHFCRRYCARTERDVSSHNKGR
jgi:hypothetical protein